MVTEINAILSLDALGFLVTISMVPKLLAMCEFQRLVSSDKKKLRNFVETECGPKIFQCLNEIKTQI